MGNFDFDSLAPKIRNILTAKDVDLSTISAKRVREMLVDEDDTDLLNVKFVREHKKEIGMVIARVFEQVNGDRQDSGDDDANDDDDEEGEEDVKVKGSKSKSKKSSSSSTNGKRKKKEEEGEEDEDEDTPPPQKKKKNGQEKNDEKLARKLSSEINGRATRGAASSSGKTKGGAAKRSRKKSSTTVDSDGEGNEDGTKKKRRGGGFKKEYILSEPLSGVLQVDKLSRPQVVKQLWDYIKGNGLQNPEDKREIVCDPSLKAVFGVNKIDMFQMNKVLGQHLHEPEAAS